jgi:Zn-dependent M16 (insulinase) family peptidase
MIGTKNHKYDVFNDRLLSCTNGINVRYDSYCDYPNLNRNEKQSIFENKENLFLEIGFLDRQIDNAFDCLGEILATPNFDEPSNIAHLIKDESISKANRIG